MHDQSKFVLMTGGCLFVYVILLLLVMLPHDDILSLS